MSATAAPKLVAVCGATGKQGGGVLAALKRIGGFQLRALTRNPASPSSTKLAAPDVEVWPGAGRLQPHCSHYACSSRPLFYDWQPGH
jgi:dihydrodipicolinate reductase